MTPLVSVLIPAYNAGEFIQNSLQSAFHQTVDDIEVIVVNDGSTDDTADRIAACKDSRLCVITQNHGGISSALNAAIHAARGAYIGFLDADDLWLPNKLARHIAVLENQAGIDVTFSWIDTINRQGKPLRMRCPRWRGTASVTELVTDFMVRTMSAVVMRRQAALDAGSLDETLICMDHEFLLRVAMLRPDNVIAIPEVLSLYRRHEGQWTHDWRLMREGSRQLLASVRQRVEVTPDMEHRVSTNMHRFFASVAYENGEFREALDLLRHGFAIAPAAFVRDTRNWIMGSAAIAGAMLPIRVLVALERSVGFDRACESTGPHSRKL
jgi:glycosyltransferase involved in cell wall biosynthesis